MKLFTEEQHAQLLSNGILSEHNPAFDPKPVVKLFTPDGAATWLLSELDPHAPDIAFGLCDLGMGMPELGSVSLAELKSVRGALGLPIERDLHFEASGRISAYAELSRTHGHIVDRLPEHRQIPELETEMEQG